MKFSNTFLRVFSTAALALAVSACGDKVPKQFRGEFADASSGTRLKLEAETGSFTTAQGKVLNAQKLKLSYDDLFAGKPGIYLRDNLMDDTLLDIYWIHPIAGTRLSEGGLEYFRAEVIYMRAQKKLPAKIEVVRLIYSAEGLVTLDVEHPNRKTRQNWQISWPPGTPALDLKRTK